MMRGMPDDDAHESAAPPEPSDPLRQPFPMHGAHVDADGVIHSGQGDFILPTGTRVLFTEHPWWGRVYEPFGRALHSWELASVLGQGIDPWGLAPGCELRWSSKAKRAWVMLPEHAARVDREPSLALTRAEVQRQLDAVALEAVEAGVEAGRAIAQQASAATKREAEKATRKELALAYQQYAAPMLERVLELEQLMVALALEPNADDKAMDRGVKVKQQILDRLVGRAIQGVEVDRVGGGRGSEALEAARLAQAARELDANGLPMDAPIEAEAVEELDEEVVGFDVPESGQVDYGSGLGEGEGEA